ncbi:hypothetical protein LTR95_004509 [Oleoguttula sp. CCFEE 5521]
MDRFSIRSDRRQSPLAMSDLEKDLFRRFIGRTAHTVPYDSAGLAALEIGIPGLALHSPPLMSSVLAFAAAHKCADLLDNYEDISRTGEAVLELLTFAETHYRRSVQLAQVDIGDERRRDYVFANAAMMVGYGLASHCVTIRLWQAQGMSPRPSGLRYATLIRASYLAYAGLAFAHGSTEALKAPNVGGFSMLSPIGRQHSPSEDPPAIPVLKADRQHPLYETLRATYQTALLDLRARMNAAREATACREESRKDSSCDWCTCDATLAEMCRILDAIFAGVAVSTSGNAAPKCGWADLSPWLRRFVQQAVASPGQPPIRFLIQNFVHRVPTKFLQMVDRELGGVSSNEAIHADSEPGGLITGTCAATHLALDIFAHWLVLLLLLDEVWWYGPIGEYELEQAITRLRKGRECTQKERRQTAYWPESMRAIYQTL